MYCVMRLQKRKATALYGLQKEARRELPKNQYNNMVNLQNSQDNIHLRDSNNWLMDTRKIIQAAGARERSNSVVGIDSVYAASPEWFREKSEEEITQYFRQCLRFHEEHYGKVISAIVHMDETSPHLHVMSVPLTQDGRLSARDLIGNREQMRQLQTEFYEQVGKQFGLQRGQERDPETKRQHVGAQEYRLQRNAALLQQQAETMQKVIDSSLTACEDAVQIQEEIYELRQDNSRLGRQNHTLQEQEERLQQRINSKTDKLHSIEEQTEKALDTKRRARAAERSATAKARAAEQQLQSVEERLQRAEYTRCLEQKLSELEEQLSPIYENERE